MTVIPDTDWTYDIETYKDVFSAVITHCSTRQRMIFEVSRRIDQSQQLAWFLSKLRDSKARMFGFNNLGFDWPILQKMWLRTNKDGYFTSFDAHAMATDIIVAQNRGHEIWPNQRMITQGDLFRIHHFDNQARSTSLKKLEIAMDSWSVKDLPYPPDADLSDEQIDEIISYNTEDDFQTCRFYRFSLDKINFRDELAIKYPDLGDVLNFSDGKIGKQYFVTTLESRGINCFRRSSENKRVPVQTVRPTIELSKCLSPKLQFQHPEFQRIHNWLATQQITETKGVFSDLSATIDDFNFDFGTGGIHGSLNSTSVHADDEWEIWDWDVASYYPNLAIVHGWYPEHLGPEFCNVYHDLYLMRKQYPKKTSQNEMLKLGLNVPYGDSNNAFSPFYDPQYTMSITLSGQLLLCMLAERLLFHNHGHRMTGIEMVQINTDGLTIRVRKNHVPWMHAVCSWWEQYTGLTLESAEYKSMFIRDVNSYIAVKTDGGVKRIGAYAYEKASESPWTREVQWHKDHSQLIVPKAAEASMVYGASISDFIRQHDNAWDFQKSVKVPRSSRLQAGDQFVQNTTRYYVSTVGVGLTKIMPPLRTKPGVYRKIGVDKGWTTTITNDMGHFDWSTVNYLYYEREAKKLCVN